jgi:hypothetical protein
MGSYRYGGDSWCPGKNITFSSVVMVDGVVNLTNIDKVGRQQEVMTKLMDSNVILWVN